MSVFLACFIIADMVFLTSFYVGLTFHLNHVVNIHVYVNQKKSRQYIKASMSKDTETSWCAGHAKRIFQNVFKLCTNEMISVCIKLTQAMTGLSENISKVVNKNQLHLPTHESSRKLTLNDQQHND